MTQCINLTSKNKYNNKKNDTTNKRKVYKNRNKQPKLENYYSNNSNMLIKI